MPANKNLTHAKRAERHAEKCANKEIEVPAQVSRIYAKWFDYKDEYGLNSEYLARTCQLIENTLSVTNDGERLELPDSWCAMLSWPLAFVNDKGGRVINELHVRAKPKMEIRLLMAGLMVAELDSPFRNHYHGGTLHHPSPVIIATGRSAPRAKPLFDKAVRILDCNPAFRESCGIPSLKTKIKSEKSNGVIKVRGMKSAAFAYGNETATFIDDFIFSNYDINFMSKARFEMIGNMNPNYLLVTNGPTKRKPRYASGAVEAEIASRDHNEQTMGNRVYLHY